MVGSPGGIDLDDTPGPTVVTPEAMPQCPTMQAETEL